MQNLQEVAIVRDPIWKNVGVPAALSKALSCKEFARLSRIKQLGPAHLAYPGATHTRAAHSIGVFCLGQRLISALKEKGATWISREGEKSFLAACLFHDAGHFPFAHSLKELSLTAHEALAAKIVRQDEVARILEEYGAESGKVAAIIDSEIPCADGEILFFRRLLSGVLDVDKLDYLTRDAYFCGVPYGAQNCGFIFSQVLPDFEKGLALNESAVCAVEHLLFSKYMMYRAVYWNKTVRIATAMMKKAIFAALKKGIVAKEELFCADDESVFALLSRHDFAERVCAEKVREGKVFRVVSDEGFEPQKHAPLENLDFRAEEEARLAKKYGVPFENIVIDVPERIGFESDLFVRDLGKRFSQVTAIFSKEAVGAMVSSLRRARVAVLQ